jgi:hypothetical protein
VTSASIQSALLNPLAASGPEVFVVCQHLGSFGTPGLTAGAPIRVRLSVGRASVQLLTQFRQSFPPTARTTLFVIPMTASHSNKDILLQSMHVYLFTGKRSRYVQSCTCVCLPESELTSLSSESMLPFVDVSVTVRVVTLGVVSY